MDNLPLSEQYRLVAKKFVDAQQAASLLEETRTAVLSQMISKNIPFMRFNQAEMTARASPEYMEYVSKMVDMRREANLLKAQLEYIRMKHSEQMSTEATARSESRL
jgi:hypothetical protein